MKHREYSDEHGGHVVELQYEQGESSYDEVFIRVPVEEDDALLVEGIVDDEQVYREAFELRDLSFDPLTALGLGERDRVNGVTSTDDEYAGTPADIQQALQSLGFVAVPEGSEWLVR